MNVGDRVRERVTGLEGIVIGITRWISGLDTCGLQPQIGSDGKAHDVQWFEVTRCDVLEENSVTIPDIEPPPGPPDLDDVT